MANMPSRSLSVLPLFVVAAVLTALAGIRHSAIVWNLVLVDHDSLGPLYHSNESKSYPSLPFLRHNPKFNRTRYTFDTFVVAGGIDIAKFGLDDHDGSHLQTPSSFRNKFFDLYQDFDLSNNLIGNETWIELLEYRRDAKHPSLSFYVDKVAFKRWLEASYSKLGIDGIPTYLLKYASELYAEAETVQTQSTQAVVTQGLLQSLPSDKDYVAKPTHLSCSGGVWLIHKDHRSNTTYVGNGKKKMKAWSATRDMKRNDRQHDTNNLDVRTEIAEDLSKNLQRVQEKCGSTVIESYALRHVRPGIVVEERFTQPNPDNSGDDDESILKGGMEFKVFTIWGKAWLTVWRPGTDGVKALFFRNGTNLVFDPPIKKNKKTILPPSTTVAEEIQQPTLPEWLDWDKVISIAETLGKHKDMFRTDIFVGVSSSSEQTEIRYVVSETEIHPTPLRGFETVFEEAGRLWLAGYYYLFSNHHGRIKVIPNTEVPLSFLESYY